MSFEGLMSLRFYQTSAHPCSYLPGQQAATVFLDPEQPLTAALYSRLITAGFRRSGTHLYRPACTHCQACISCRVRVREFEPGRRFKRIWKRNQDITSRALQAETLDSPEYFDLYVRYISHRQADGDMFPPSREQYVSFIQASTQSTRFHGFYLQGTLIAVCILDELDHGLSAMYTFFEPDLPKRSLGNYVILWQIEKALRLNLPFLYLGYWIKDCGKMNYKAEYRPLELLVANRWTLLT